MDYNFNPKLFAEEKQLKISRMTEQIKLLREKQALLQKHQTYLQNTKSRLLNIQKAEMPVLDTNTIQNNGFLAKDEYLGYLDNDLDVLNCLAMDEDDTEFKKLLWEAENYDWIKKQNEKNELNSKKMGSFGNREVAVSKCESISRKINYNVLKPSGE
jgi:hypothetical protein